MAIREYMPRGLEDDEEARGILQSVVGKRIRETKAAIVEAVVQARAATAIDQADSANQNLLVARALSKQYALFLDIWQELGGELPSSARANGVAAGVE